MSMENILTDLRNQGNNLLTDTEKYRFNTFIEIMLLCTNQIVFYIKNVISFVAFKINLLSETHNFFS